MTTKFKKFEYENYNKKCFGYEIKSKFIGLKVYENGSYFYDAKTNETLSWLDVSNRFSAKKINDFMVAIALDINSVPYGLIIPNSAYTRIINALREEYVND